MLELLKRGRPPPDEDRGADERVHFVDVGCGAGAVTNQVKIYIISAPLWFLFDDPPLGCAAHGQLEVHRHRHLRQAA